MSKKLINQERAEEILERENIDGLVVTSPINFYYVSGYWALYYTPLGFDSCYFSVMPKDNTKSSGIVIPALEVRRLETMGKPWIENIFLYSAKGDGELFDDDFPKGQDYKGWPVDPSASLNPLEEKWKSIIDEYRDSYSENSIQALIRAIKSADLDGKKVLIDDLRIEKWLSEEKGVDIDCIFRPELFNEIRMVKTENEIEIMREAAIINEQSMLAAIDFMSEGATWEELENFYMSEMAKRGGRGVYMMCGVGELPNGVCEKGEPIMFDALGQYKRYHGDFGRCAVIGNPSQLHIERHQAILEGWEKAKEFLKPGTTYDQISEEVGNHIRSLGFDSFRNPVVHGLGLEHTDDPKNFGTQPGVKISQTLEKNMIINIDMPFTEIGWGSVHMEDTILITDDGFERLSSADFDLRSS